ncbi:MAG: hypothetical protein HFI10_11805 [Lachnospiraceae bacterium]|jgi:putative DNA primase/helicase|nr:hypothetical protein [Lachnospiraceae bacterium]
MRMTFYTANCRGNAKNSLYPNRRVIDNEDDCMEVVAFDHVCAEFKNCRRSNDNFLSCDVDVMDCDNGHSDNPEDWIHPEDLEEKIGKDVAFAVVTSRNHMKPKDGKSARPRFHVYFPHDPVTDGEVCAALKKAIQQKFPFFDAKALDSARFIFGHPADSIFWHEGEITIDCIVKPQGGREIPQGQRNATMSHFAGRVVKRYGATEKAHEIFMEEAAKCNPPLEDAELAMIWQSACRFAEKVQGQEGYVAPDAYNDEFGRESLKPGDYSDIGQAKVLTREYGVELRYTAATDYLRFCGQYWVESKQQAVGAAEEFLDLQLADAKDEIARTKQALMDTGISEDAITSGGKSLEKKISGGQMDAYLAYMSAQAYKAFVMKRRDMKYVVSALQAAKPMLEISVSDLDKDGFLLNTPDGTYYLPDGLEGKRDHSPEDYITKITAAAPGDKGEKLWLDSLDTIFCKDRELIDYVQQIVGMAAVGRVYWICRSKKETGMSCTSVNFSEEELKRISAQALGMDGFDEAGFEKTVRGMVVLQSGDIEFRLSGGETKVWKNLHLDPPRHIATVTDCFQGKIRCAACGNTYHRVNSAGKWVYWYCIGKKRKNVECHNANCTDYKLRQVSAHMMGLEEFDEAEFERQVEGITALEDGSLEFQFKEGRTERWQKV